MRTVIFVLGLLFCGLVIKNYNLDIISDKASNFLGFIFMFVVILDCIKK